MRLSIFILSLVVMVSNSACNNDDCVTPEPIEIEIPSKYCDVENPLTDLPWLNEVYDSIKGLGSESDYIHIYELMNGEELIELTNFMNGDVFDCSGKYLCSYGGWSDTCDTLLYVNVRQRRVLYPE
jgi:hypothetical protein